MAHTTSTPSQAPSETRARGPGPAWPPGPRALTGWSHLRAMSRDLLGAVQRWQQVHGDMVHLRIWPEHEVVVMDPALARELLVHHHDALQRWERGLQVFAQVHGRSVLVAEGEPWQRQRHALQPAFSPKAVQAFVPTIAEAAADALRAWPARHVRYPVESAITSLAMDVILRLLFSSRIGADARAAEQAVHAIGAVADKEMYWPASWPDSMPWKRRKREALATLRGLIDRQVQARRAMGAAGWPDDLLSRLLRLQQEHPGIWTDTTVRDECMTTFLAGHETLAATLTWWAACMAAHPQAHQQAADEVAQRLGTRMPDAADLDALPWLRQTLQETLRMYPAAPVLFSRRSTRAITLGPWRLPPRTLFMVPVHRLHHDPRTFPEPQAFRPERFGPDAPPLPRGAWLPFGVGPRVCLGQHLALAEMTVIAAMVLQRFRLAPAEGEPAPRPVMRVTLRPERPLHLQLLMDG